MAEQALSQSRSLNQQVLAALNQFDNRLAESDLNLQLIKAKHMDKNEEIEDVGSARMISE